MDIGTIVAIIVGVFSCVGVIISLCVFVKSNKKDHNQEGQDKGTLYTEIGYIKSNTDRILKKQEDQDIRINNLEKENAVLKTELHTHINNTAIHSKGSKSKKEAD